MENNAGYFDKLLKSSGASKKPITVYLDDTKIERIDMVIKCFSEHSDAKSFARNTLIETAVDKFLTESEVYLLESHGMDVSALIQEARSEIYDTVIFSARGRGFEETFMGEEEPACWYPCRISDERMPELKYIAIYRGQPISAITHYAKIKEFRYEEERKCRVCYFEGDPIELPHRVILGNRGGYYFKGTKYTTLKSLLNATRSDDLVFG